MTISPYLYLKDPNARNTFPQPTLVHQPRSDYRRARVLACAPHSGDVTCVERVQLRMPPVPPRVPRARQAETTPQEPCACREAVLLPRGVGRVFRRVPDHERARAARRQRTVRSLPLREGDRRVYRHDPEGEADDVLSLEGRYVWLTREHDAVALILVASSSTIKNGLSRSPIDNVLWP